MVVPAGTCWPIHYLMLATLPFITKKDAVVERLRTEILDGRLGAGAAVIQEDVAVRFGVSPTPVREALGILESEGFLESRPHRGFVVTRRGSLDSAEMEAILEVRAVLEAFALRRLSSVQARTACEYLRENLRLADEALRKGRVHDFRELNAEFHRELSRGTGSQVVSSMLTRLSTHSMFVPGLDHGRMAEVLRDHQQIGEALGRGKTAAAAVLLASHLRRNLVAFRRSRNTNDEGVTAEKDGLVPSTARSALGQRSHPLKPAPLSPPATVRSARAARDRRTRTKSRRPASR